MVWLNAASFLQFTTITCNDSRYMTMQHGDVYSSFQVPQKTWGAAHA